MGLRFLTVFGMTGGEGVWNDMCWKAFGMTGGEGVWNDRRRRESKITVFIKERYP